ncbi:Molybdenum cofactor synthesis protein 1 [Kickxella alabastrina]|uniref:Molybdenum cofactor synthesis protein 1 n=1 Tax=Kickxella alabastrina TaxID=61397 RepID=A0ACC1IB01_9FUNG|nr:Molybdenum cofactor synthesis protein 1 [Kickxella alabastrina]
MFKLFRQIPAIRTQSLTRLVTDKAAQITFSNAIPNTTTTARPISSTRTEHTSDHYLESTKSAGVSTVQNHTGPSTEQQKELPALSDLFGRFHNYLRISVTERCNLRCQYCMPEEGIDLTENDKLLTTEEIIRVAKIFVQQGVDKIRLTGGEPTVRKDIVELIQGLNELRPLGLRKIAITTNGIALRRKLPLLRSAGLDGLNISLDTRDPRKFELFTRRKGGAHVLQAIAEAGKLGFQFVKVNVVVMRGMNEDEVPAFVEMTHDEELDVRFIEYMPFDGNQWGQKKMVGYRDMLDSLRKIYGDNIEQLPLEDNHTTKGYRIKGYRGQFGFITSMTHSFCSTCNRVRVMADGNLKVCLFGNTEISLRDLLRSGSSDAEIVSTISQAIKRKQRAHAGIDILSQLPNRPMIKIGG